MEGNKILSIYEDKFIKKKLSLPLLNEMPRKAIQKEKKTFKYVFNKIRLKKCASATISKPSPTYHVAYLGNVVTGWAKGEGCIEKPLTTLWRNYIQSSRPDVNMQLTVSGGGLKAITKNHGLTEYWAHRLTTCSAPAEFPRIFCWVYRHEGKRLRHELRCHAVLCVSSEVASQIEKELKSFLSQALNEFKKEKLLRQNARLSLVNSINENASLPRRKILLGIGSHNYRPPLECSKSAPKLSSIEEIFEDDDNDMAKGSREMYKNILKSYERNSFLFEQGNHYRRQISRREKQEGQKTNSSSKEQDKDALYIKNSDQRVTFVSNLQTLPTTSESNLNVSEEIAQDLEKKVDIDFKIGGEVLPPPIKGLDIEHTFVNPIISKGLMEQEQVSLVPVGESHTDFSSLKVYKRKTFSEMNKDFGACVFLSGENVNQIENIFQTHCSFSGDRSEEDIPTKINTTLIV